MLENIRPSDLPSLPESEKVDPFKMPKVSELPSLDNIKSSKKIDSMPNVEKLPPLDKTELNTSENGDKKELESQDVNEIKRIPCRNETLAGQAHPETGVPFEEKTVENADGEKIIGVFPVFESTFDAQLPEELNQASDKKQFAECNEQLKESLKNNSDLKSKFSEEQLEQIDNGDTPDGYTWHHHEETGKMQLVDTEIHNKTGHTGGKAVWGGGSENR